LLCSICSARIPPEKHPLDFTIREWVTANPPDVKNLAGRVYVVEFWATWCRPCIQNIPHLIALTDKYRDKGLELIALSQDKSVEEVRRCVRQKKINYHVAVDSGTANWYGITSYPTLLVVDHRGKVVWEGYPWDGEFEKAIDRAITAAPPPLLAGVDLGPFDHLRKYLFGGSGFARAYLEIQTCAADRKEQPKCAIAEKIVQTIDRRISEKIAQADKLRNTDLLAAYNIYADIVSRYDGIKVVEPAKAAYLELKEHKGLKNLLLAATRTPKTLN